jgi:hypothetical protein
MNSKLPLAAAFAAVLLLTHGPALAAASDYTFEPVPPELKKGDDVTVAVRLVNKLTGKPVPDAVIIRTRVDMAPDGMADMQSPVSILPAPEPGIYAFKTDLPMAGRYQLSVAAKVQGEMETVSGSVVIKASK